MTSTYGFIGVGTISCCVIHGLFKAEKGGGWTGVSQEDPIVLSPRGKENVLKLANQYGSNVTVAQSNQEVVDKCRIVFLGVLPDQVQQTLAPLTFRSSQVLVSMVSTTPCSELAELCGGLVKENIIRTIPMPAVRQLQGTILLHPPNPEVFKLFSLVGKVVPVEEESQFGRLIALTCFQGDLYKRLAIMHKWLLKDGVPEETSVNFVSALFNTIISDVKDPSSGEIFDELVKEQTPGGLNEGVIKWQKDMGAYESLEKSLDKVYAKIKGVNEE